MKVQTYKFYHGFKIFYYIINESERSLRNLSFSYKKAEEKEDIILSKRQQMNKGNQLRPGSPLYVQVIDFDQDVSEKQDTISVPPEIDDKWTSFLTLL